MLKKSTRLNKIMKQYDVDRFRVQKNQSMKKSIVPSWTQQPLSQTKLNKRSVNSNSEWAVSAEWMSSCWTKAGTQLVRWALKVADGQGQGQHVVSMKDRDKQRSKSRLMQNPRYGFRQVLFTLAILPEQEQASSGRKVIQQLQRGAARPGAYSGLWQVSGEEIGLRSQKLPLYWISIT